ncbi:MAG: hypothetical protein ACLT98_17895 [Eggerthellaceae bacterium]
MEFVNSAWALAPAIIAIVLALVTKEVYISLFVGIVMGALLVAGFNPVTTLDTIVGEGLVPPSPITPHSSSLSCLACSSPWSHSRRRAARSAAGQAPM